MGVPELLVGIVIAGLAGLAVVLVAFRRQEVRTRETLRRSMDALTRSRALAESDLALLRTDITLLAAQLQEFTEVDPHFTAPLRAELRDLARGIESLTARLTAAEAPADVQEATAALSRGRQAMVALMSRLAEETPPAVRPPCFFNPNHGPSSTIVMWTGEDERPVRVPCCAPDAERLRSGAAPYSRTVANDGVRVPWWEAGTQVSPWAMGWFQDWLNPGQSRADLVASFPSLFTAPEAPSPQGPPPRAERRVAL